MNRYAQDDRGKQERIIRVARNLARQPGDVAPFGGGGMAEATDVVATIETATQPDGNELPPMLWDVDNWNEAVWG